MEAALIVLIGAQFLLMMWREEQWRKERSDLLNRLVAGQTIPVQIDISEKPPPKGGNMCTAGLRKAAQQQYDYIQNTMKDGDV
jgi:hypothetical protein